jgi:hypothetical protein
MVDLEPASIKQYVFFITLLEQIVYFGVLITVISNSVDAK